MSVSPKYVQVPQATKHTCISDDTLRKLLRQGRVKGQKIGRDWLISPQEVSRLEREYPLGDLVPHA